MTGPNAETLPTPEEICAFLEAYGWIRDGEPDDRWIPYRNPGLERSEVIVPRFYGLIGYHFHALFAIDAVARFISWRNPSGYMAALATVPPPEGFAR
jgi:hypothetical protein